MAENGPWSYLKHDVYSYDNGILIEKTLSDRPFMSIFKDFKPHLVFPKPRKLTLALRGRNRMKL